MKFSEKNSPEADSYVSTKYGRNNLAANIANLTAALLRTDDSNQHTFPEANRPQALRALETLTEQFAIEQVATESIENELRGTSTVIYEIVSCPERGLNEAKERFALAREMELISSDALATDFVELGATSQGPLYEAKHAEVKYVLPRRFNS